MTDDLRMLPRDVNDLPTLAPATIYSTESPIRPQSGSLLDYFLMIWRRKTLLAGCMLAGLLVALGVLLPQTPVYRARTTLEVQELNHNFTDMRLASPIEDSSTADAVTDIQTQIKFLQSDTLINRALNNAHIFTAAELEPQRGEGPRWAGFLQLPTKAVTEETLAQIAGKNLKASVEGQTRIVEITFDAANPDLAARFANSVADELIDENTETRWQMNRQTSVWLGGQLADLRNQLETSEKALQNYAREQNLIYTGDRQNISEEKLRQLQADLSKAQADRMEKQSRFEIAQSTPPNAIPEVLNDASLRALETNLTDLQQKKAELEVTFTGDYGKTKKLQAEIDTLRDAVRQKRGEIVSRIASELAESERHEQLLAGAYANQTMRVTDDSQKSIQYDVLKRQVDTNQQIYDGMLQRVKEATIASAIKTPNVRVIDPAVAPLHPFKPDVPVGSAVGLLSGAMFGILAIVLRSRTDVSVQEPGEASVLLGIPELGVIPRARTGRGDAAMALVPREPRLEDPKGRLSLPASSLVVADSFRAVLTSIILGGMTQQQRVLVVTSACSGEGKTTTAANLAITLANMNRKVLLIDGDIRNPRLHRIFGLKNSIGVTNLVKPPNGPDGLLSPAIQTAAFPGLCVLTSGPAGLAGADVLYSAELAAMIEIYRERFDMVLIDTPPVLSIPDARVLGRIADGVVLVARAGKTSRTAIQSAFQRLVDDRSKVLGIILNDWNSKRSPYRYYGAYGYSKIPGTAPGQDSSRSPVSLG